MIVLKFIRPQRREMREKKENTGDSQINAIAIQTIPSQPYRPQKVKNRITIFPKFNIDLTRIKAGDWSEWVDLCKKGLELFDPRGIGIALSAIVRNLPKKDIPSFLAKNRALILAMLYKVQKGLPLLHSRVITDLFYFFGKSKIEDEKYFALLVEALEIKILEKSYLASDLCDTIGALCLMEHIDEQLWQTVSKAMQNCMHELPGHKICFLAMVLANANKRDLDLFAAISEHAAALIKLPQPPGMGALWPDMMVNQLVQAYMKMQISDRSLFEALALDAQRQLSSFGNRELSMLSYCFGMLHIKNIELFKGIAHVIMQKGIETFEPRDLVSLVYGFGKLELMADKWILNFYDLVEKQAQRKISQFSQSDISMLLFAFSKSNMSVPTLFRLIDEHLMKSKPSEPKMMEQLSPANFLNVIYAYAHTNYVNAHNRDFITLLLIELKKKILKFPTKELIASLLRFIFIFNYCELNKLKPPSDEELNICYAILIELEKKLAVEAEIDNEGISQLVQVYLYLRFFHPKFYDSKTFPLLTAIIQKFLKNPNQITENPCELQKEIHADLERLLHRPIEGECILGCYIADMVFKRNKVGGHLGEVIGPYHILSSGEFTGPDLFRSRILNTCGWQITYFNVIEHRKARKTGIEAGDKYLLSQLLGTIYE